MLKEQNIKISGRKKSELNNTPGEIVRDNIVKTGLKNIEEATYVAGNKKKIILETAQKAGGVINE